MSDQIEITYIDRKSLLLTLKDHLEALEQWGLLGGPTAKNFDYVRAASQLFPEYMDEFTAVFSGIVGMWSLPKHPSVNNPDDLVRHTRLVKAYKDLIAKVEAGLMEEN